MKRLLIAGLLSVSLHALLFSMDAEWLKTPPSYPRIQGLVTIALDYKKNDNALTDRKPIPAGKQISPPRTHSEKQHPPPEPEPPETKTEPVRSPVNKPLNMKDRPSQKPIEKNPKTQKPKNPVRTLQPLPAPDRVQTESAAGSVARSTRRSIPDTEEVPNTEAQTDATPQAPGKNHQTGRASDMTEFLEDPTAKLTPPNYRKNPPPPYPAVARRRGYEGTVVLEVLVDEDGVVKDSRIMSSSGHFVLDRTALRAIQKWEFVAGTRGNKEVAMWVKVPVRFQLK